MKNKKEILKVTLSVVISVLAVSFFAAAATTISNNITAGGTIAINGAAHSTELSVIGTASVSEDLWASGSFQFAGGEGTATLSYSRLGSNTTGHSLADADDLLITGLLEVDDTAFFDGNVSLSDSGTLTVANIVGHTDSGQYLRIGDVAATGHGLDANDDLLVNGELEVDGTSFFDGAVSVSDTNGLEIGGGISFTGGTASPSANCVAGSWYFRAGSTVSASLYFCDTINEWDVVSIDSAD